MGHGMGTAKLSFTLRREMVCFAKMGLIYDKGLEKNGKKGLGVGNVMIWIRMERCWLLRRRIVFGISVISRVILLGFFRGEELPSCVPRWCCSVEAGIALWIFLPWIFI